MKVKNLSMLPGRLTPVLVSVFLRTENIHIE
jgi:hypothetical protein